jgi:OmpR family response regulator RpaB
MSKKILIADDDLTLTHLMGTFLTEHGYTVVLAHDGDQALKVFEREHPDLIVLDVVMPKVNGYDFIFEMRKIEDAAKTPVIVITSKADMADIFKVEGVSEYLVKPFFPQALLEKVKKYA